MHRILFISGGEIVIVFLAVLLLFGAKKIPEFARALGKGMNEFRKAADDIKKEIRENSGGITDEINDVKKTFK